MELFRVAELQNQPRYPPMDECIKKLLENGLEVTEPHYHYLPT
jgi:hypothetical protein